MPDPLHPPLDQPVHQVVRGARVQEELLLQVGGLAQRSIAGLPAGVEDHDVAGTDRFAHRLQRALDQFRGKQVEPADQPGEVDNQGRAAEIRQRQAGHIFPRRRHVLGGVDVGSRVHRRFNEIGFHAVLNQVLKGADERPRVARVWWSLRRPGLRQVNQTHGAASSFTPRRRRWPPASPAQCGRWPPDWHRCSEASPHRPEHRGQTAQRAGPGRYRGRR